MIGSTNPRSSKILGSESRCWEWPLWGEQVVRVCSAYLLRPHLVTLCCHHYCSDSDSTWCDLVWESSTSRTCLVTTCLHQCHFFWFFIPPVTGEDSVDSVDSVGASLQWQHWCVGLCSIKSENDWAVYHFLWQTLQSCPRLWLQSALQNILKRTLILMQGLSENKDICPWQWSYYMIAKIKSAESP